MINEQARIRRIASYLLAAVVMFILTYLMSYKEAVMEASDMTVHMNASSSLSSVLGLTHNGWHVVCWMVYNCLPVKIETAAALTTAGFNAVTAAAAMYLVDRYTRPDYEKKGSLVWPALITAASMIAGPLYLRFFNENYYLGQSSPNPWHNPTSLAARPFALIITILTVAYWDLEDDEKFCLFGKTLKKTHVYQFILMVLLAYDTVIKPSFLMIYLPACGLILLARLIRRRGRNLLRLILGHLYFIPAIIILLWQYLIIFISPSADAAQSSEGGIAISFFSVAKLHTDSVTLSLILKMAFPFLVIIIWHKVLFKDKLFHLVIMNYLMGLAVSWTLTETGVRANHGNFGWSNMLGSSILWIFCVAFFAMQFISWFKSKKQITSEDPAILRFLIPGFFLFWHLAAGMAYYVYLIQNMAKQF